jgi:hypothetical protein
MSAIVTGCWPAGLPHSMIWSSHAVKSIADAITGKNILLIFIVLSI